MYCPVCRSDYPDDWKVCPKDTANLLRAAQIGKYGIEGLLGVGGMGAVYRAVNPDTKGRVAIKVMNPSVANADAARQRFQREAAAVAALRTSHVVKVFDFGEEDDGTLYLVMELLDGHSLREEIAPGPDYMDLARVQMVMDGALRGLAAAHKAGIVHRDLKPENVFVADTDDGEVPKLLDFGIARVRTKDSDLTRTGSMMGTAGYMAVEQIAAGSGDVGPWSDVYGLGTILYEMLSGTAAFGGTTLTDVLSRVLRGEIVSLQSIRTGLPPAVYALVERCMSLEPQKRPQDAEAMRVALTAARLVPAGSEVPPPRKTKAGSSLVGLAATVPPPRTSARVDPSAPTTASIPPTLPTTSGVASRGGSRSKLPLIIGGVLAAGLGGFVIVRAMSDDEPKPPLTEEAQVSPPSVPSTAPQAGSGTQNDPIVNAVIDAATTEALDAPVVVRDIHDGMVAIAAGTYDFGEDTKVNSDGLSRGKLATDAYWIDEAEMTLAAFRSALGDPSAGGIANDDAALPARNVTWDQAVAACTAIGKRLPTEREWEVAALVAPPDAASAYLMTSAATVLVASPRTECSPAGLCDMLGSVSEWTADEWPKQKGSKVVRGASFRVSPSAGWAATIHVRASQPAKLGDVEVGFRCALGGSAQTADLKPTPKPTPKPQQPCEPNELLAEAREANRAGNYALAIQHAQRGLACGGTQPGFHVQIVQAACKSNKPALAKKHIGAVPRGRANALTQMCEERGIRL